MHKGERGDKVFFIFIGKVDVFLREGEDPISTLGPGQSFGELALMYDAPRQASVRCQTACAFGSLQRAPFNKAVSHQKLLEQNRVITHLERVPPFSVLREQTHSWMAGTMHLRRLQVGQIIEPPELRDMLALPMSGVFEVRGTITISAGEVVRSLVRNRMLNLEDADEIRPRVIKDFPFFLLQKGDFFGEDVLLNPVDMTVEETRCWIGGVTFSDFYLVSRNEATLLTMTRKNLEKLLVQEKDFHSYLKLRNRLQFGYRKEQVQKVMHLVSKPDYDHKCSQYLRDIHRQLEKSLTIRDDNKEVDAFDRKVLLDSKEMKGKRQRADAITRKWNKYENKAATYLVNAVRKATIAGAAQREALPRLYN